VLAKFTLAVIQLRNRPLLIFPMAVSLFLNTVQA